MLTPAWVRDAIFYQIFPDRFAQSKKVAKASHLEVWHSPPTIHGYKGGDLLGVLEKLDYLEDLGISALYFNPIFQSASNHRYHTHDYFQVDPMLGGNRAFKKLLKELHKRQIRLILDGVFNHASRGFFQFHDILENAEASAYLDWFHIHSFPLHAYGQGKAGYEAWWELKALPKFNTQTKAVREFLWQVASYWLKQGIDGWRLDVPNEIDDDSFWQEFRKRCRKLNPEAYIVGEIWEDPRRWLQGDQFDAVMNYPLNRAIFGFVSHDLNDREIARSGHKHIRHLDATSFATTLRKQQDSYPQEFLQAQFNLLGSHDTARALTILKGNQEAFKLAYLLLFCLPGTPCIYYGDELGLVGSHDPGCRQTMPWSHVPSWNHDLLGYFKALIRMRKNHISLRQGNVRIIKTVQRCIVFLLEHPQETALVALNAGDEPQYLQLELSQGDYLSGLSEKAFRVDSQTTLLSLAERSSQVYFLAK